MVIDLERQGLSHAAAQEQVDFYVARLELLASAAHRPQVHTAPIAVLDLPPDWRAVAGGRMSPTKR
jgi:hypothetical protein